MATQKIRVNYRIDGTEDAAIFYEERNSDDNELNIVDINTGASMKESNFNELLKHYASDLKNE